MKHLIKIEDLTVDDINNIYECACAFERGEKKANFKDKYVCNMFFENSTRTKLSFEMAQSKININKFNFEANVSSINKGEDMFDTINNLVAIGMDAFVLRHKDDNLIQELSKMSYFKEISFVNAGSGKSAHPTQALLDFYTIKSYFSDLKGKTITITGDIAHSRVAKSNIALLKKFYMNIRCLAPIELQGEKIEGVDYYTSLKEAFEGSDIIMALRIQKERFENETLNLDDYIKNYQINENTMPDNAILMHPGPINKDIEISSSLLNSNKGETILKQTQNGVFIRMAVLNNIIETRGF